MIQQVYEGLTRELVNRIVEHADREGVSVDTAAAIWRDGNQAGFDAGTTIAYTDALGIVARLLEDPSDDDDLRSAARGAFVELSHRLDREEGD